MDIKIFNKGNGWVGGKCGDYDFEAKVYDNGSKFGIDNGRVSKLAIWDGEERQYSSSFVDVCSVYYEREWLKKPNGELKNCYDKLIKELENYREVEW